MSDNNRKNLQEEKQDREQHDFVEEFTQIFNSNTQNKNQNSHHTHSSVESDYSTPQTPFQNDDFDLSFLEDNFENDSVGELLFDSQNEPWNLQSNINNPASIDTPPLTSNPSEKDSSFSEGMHIYPPHNDEEQILETLSPLPIKKNEGLQDKAVPTNNDPFFETDDFNTNLENFSLDEIDKQNKNTVTRKVREETEAFLLTNAQQKANDTQSNYDSKQSTYHTPINSPYKMRINQQNLGNNHYDGGFLKQEEKTLKTAEYKDAQTQYTQNNINVTEDISYKNSINEIQHNQNNLNDTQTLSEPFNTTQTENFFVHGYSHIDNPPPEVDTYKFADEIVEKTEPIIASKILYETPKYDISVDSLQKEFSEVFNVGNISSEDFLQQQQNDSFNEISHHTKQDLEENSINTLQHSANYSSVGNKEQSPSLLSNNSQHKSADEVPTHVLVTSSSKNFIRKSFSRGIIFFALIAISVFGYARFFTSPNENNNPLIIYADNTPFKVKPETTETENNVTHDLTIYNQKNNKAEIQESTPQPLVDSSETPENLTALNEKASENEKILENTSLASSHEEPNIEIEDAITKALDHTLPTREVQTVIVKADGTMVLTPAHQTNEKLTNQSEVPTNQSEIINQSAGQHQDQDDTADSVQLSNINDNQTEDGTTTNIDAIIAESASIPDNENSFIPDESTSIPKTEKSFVPVPLSVKPNSITQTHSGDRSNLSAQVTTQNSESYYVQLASHPTSALAEDSLRKLKSKFGSLIGGRPFNVQSTFIPEKGTYYRVRIQTQNRNEAINLCENIKNSGGNCLVTR
ncbi:SPOR domain-containing protein [Bartonella bovis]|uniref:Putative membrane protein n=1 Tax=Bartonella bovis m02 TaxID=1094492 RepID=N6VKH8_9HYPH|nr:SPOR domain-containing protein [Bartonella bovis]ENN93701.1 putative membrane protein [Bartonella bovis m02]